jgi:D-serine deaminase-like pyridoxal phosphate-dependent protein
VAIGVADTSPGPSAPPLPEGIDTPSAFVDLGRLEANIRSMQDFADSRAIHLRPHAKTHKSVRVAELQRQAGARGLTVGTLGEAETFAAAGFDDLFLAYTVWAGGPKGRRIRALHDRIRLTVAIDSDEGAAALAGAVQGADRPLGVLVEVDSGGHRAGVKPDDAGRIAATAARAGLEIIGVFTHGGRAYASPEAAAGAADDEVTSLARAAVALAREGIEAKVLSAGTTPTARLSARAPVNEVRPGTYVYCDRNQFLVGSCSADSLAFFVAATVVSTAVDGQFVIDAGAKALARDPPGRGGSGYAYVPAWPDATVVRLNDYHGVVTVAPGSPRPRVGEVLAVAPNHVCPVVDLYADLAVIREGNVVDRWPVDARGRSG